MRQSLLKPLLKRLLPSLLTVAIALLSILLTTVVPLADPVQAATWDLIAESADGRVRQYIDWESLERHGSQVTVESYATEQILEKTAAKTPGKPADTMARFDYTTLYDCDRQQFKDLRLNGQALSPASALAWAPTAPDPLNHAVMEAVCAPR